MFLQLLKEKKEILLITGLAILFFYKLFIHPTQMIYPANDTIAIYSAEKVLFSRSVLEDKSIPLWNPYLFGGMPFIGNASTEMFYPLSILYLIFPTDNVFGFMFVIDTAVLGVSTYLFARLIGLKNAGAIISSVITMFSGIITSLLYLGQIINLNVFAWFPLLLLTYELGIVTKKYLYGVAAGVVVALMLLAGHPQIAAYSITAGLLYFLLRLFFITKNDPKKIALIKFLPILFFSIVIGFLLSAVQVLPELEFTSQSIRSMGIDFAWASSYSMHPLRLLTILTPHLFGYPINNTFFGKGDFFGHNIYIGVLGAILAFLGVYYSKNKYTFIFLFLGLFSILFALGSYTPLFAFFYHFVPGFNNFRVPSRFLYIYAFSFSILAGYGAEAVSGGKIKILKTISLVLLATACVASTVLILGQNSLIILLKSSTQAKYFLHLGMTDLFTTIERDLFILGFISLIIFFLIFLRQKKFITKTIFTVSLVFLVFTDLFLFGTEFYTTKSPQSVFINPGFSDKILAEKNDYRVLDISGNLIDLAVRDQIQNLIGIQSLYLRNYRDFLWLLGPHGNKLYESFFEIKGVSKNIILSLLNTKYVISQKKIDTEGLKLIKVGISKDLTGYNNSIFYIYENISVLPRAYIVPNGVVLKNKDQIFDKILSKSFNPKEQIILDHNPQVPLNNPGGFHQAPIEEYHNNNININIKVADPGFLVLSETWYPGWHAYDNGAEVPIYKTDYILRSIYLKKGQHQIVFKFIPSSFELGKKISLASLAALLVYLFIMKTQPVQKEKKRS